ncbi:zinc finger protein 143 isoform X1 [Scleropages formosus]|uniref:Zinc finger protein 143 n=1 Tax=Scleropages formosus TaxID=113540 RepID=A0A8C9V3R6_SCLFO|nr:zinc finger protein 143-like isoform X1 [Scleropages formosus]XP_018615616.1 zinc finger protein 143-like isoform X1 [Scleropages formosus]
MLLAQINRDSQGMAEFQAGGGEAQHVTLCLAEAVAVADGDQIESMDTVSLQAVTLVDGSTAYIQHSPKVSISDGKLMDGQVIQLEDGSAAYVQHVSMPKTGEDSLRLEDGQAVQLEDGTTAYIHHTPKEVYDQSALQAVQLEDGTTAYIQHTVQMPQSNTILAIQADGTVSDLHADSAIDPETISVLEQYTTKVESAECISSTGLVSSSEPDGSVQMQIVLQSQGQGGSRNAAKAQQTGEKSFRCDYDGCGKLYTTAHHLKVHERSHTGDRPYLCDHLGCGKKFATGYGLKSHIRTHTGEKPYRCQEMNCRKSFKTSGDLQKHIRTHTGERPFKCPFEGCGRSFTTSNIRKVHIRTHTGERPYYCSEPGCGRAFASATNYKNHMRIHTGEKPYVCTVPGCDKRFTEYSSLYKHHVVHTPCKPYNCNHCGKTYKQISTLAMHKRTAHNDTEPIEEEQEAYFEPPGEAIDESGVTYVPGVEEEDSGSELVSAGTPEVIGQQQVALITQDGTQQVSISHGDMQAMADTITMVTQDGTTITVPAHEAMLSSGGAHSVTMVTADGTEGQVAIVTPDLATFQTTQAELNQEHQLVTASPHPVTLLATSNGTQIAVQLSEQPSLEEAIRIASRIQQGETPGLDD